MQVFSELDGSDFDGVEQGTRVVGNLGARASADHEGDEHARQPMETAFGFAGVHLGLL